jgi:hypothetical protein
MRPNLVPPLRMFFGQRRQSRTRDTINIRFRLGLEYIMRYKLFVRGDGGMNYDK